MASNSKAVTGTAVMARSANEEKKIVDSLRPDELATCLHDRTGACTNASDTSTNVWSANEHTPSHLYTQPSVNPTQPHI